MPTARLRFFGVAAYELIHTNGRRILVDPFLDDCPGNPVKSDQLDKADPVVVSHAAMDPPGATETIDKRHGCAVRCGGEVRAYLVAKGVPDTQIRATTWGIRVRVADVEVQ